MIEANWQQQAQEYLINEDYSVAAKLYREAIEREPDIKSYYWYLGLLLLLQGQETEAQVTWFTALSEVAPADFDTKELLEVLNTEAERRITIEDYHLAWAIRQHIREIAPENINNLLGLVVIVIQLPTFEDDCPELLKSISDSLSMTIDNCDLNLLSDVINKLLIYTSTEKSEFNSIVDFVKICLQNYPDSLIKIIIRSIMVQCIKVSAFYKRPDLASKFAELCLERIPKNYHLEHREILIAISYMYQNCGQYDKGIESSKLCYELSDNLVEKMCTNHVVLRGLMTSGSYWQEANDCLQEQIILAGKLIETKPDIDHIVDLTRLSQALFFLPYFEDKPERNHILKNQISSFCQSQFIEKKVEIAERNSKNINIRRQNLNGNKQVFNIGYISHCFKKHSVGWLCRWLFKYHNPERFKISCYSFDESERLEMFTENNFVRNSYNFYKFGLHQNDKVWEQVQGDEIDILVDLDSLTSDIICELMSIKSAPIQVTWLGWDSSGLPSIDYFIADPYVLPESAQNYYSETIWRLPQTYIAVDGFEVDVPDLRREDLDIPSDAIIYFMTQKGYKRHLPHLKLQMRIIKEVPNSYLLIKGDADPKTTKLFFEKIAEEEGVDFERIRFLPNVLSEAVHRANLQIADVVLDTYPYNGATTTLETLWMGVPLVTRVGEQFSARNSYGMMMNAGITEGIAWSEDEYVEWGVRLGKDEKLRQEISWKLRQSRHTAPLWNAKKFTREMETAYEQMWQRYVDS